MSDQDQPNREGESKLHIDADWKSEARAEKERLAQQSRQTEEQQSGGEGDGAGEGGGGGGGQRGLPPADFKTLVSTMVTQALMAMGAIPDPQSGQRTAVLDLAKHHIDMLGVLEHKTQGNRDEEEEKLLSQALNELRMHYLELQRRAQEQGQNVAGGGAQGTPQSGIQGPPNLGQGGGPQL